MGATFDDLEGRECIQCTSGAGVSARVGCAFEAILGLPTMKHMLRQLQCAPAMRVYCNGKSSRLFVAMDLNGKA